MGRISTGIGLISGINSKDIIDQLMAIEERPKTQLQTRIDDTNRQKVAYTDISARLTGLNLSAQLLAKPATFQQATTSSSNENVITATAGAGAAAGSFQFQVARLVASQQSITDGFSDPANQKVGAGTITIEQGGGEIYSQTSLAQLNGGTGVRRGSFRITDGSGRSGVIDISQTLTLDDVVKTINTNLDLSVRAAVSGDHITLTDISGQTVSNLSVADLGNGHAAADLGIAGAGSDGALEGTDINYVGRSTLLADLNDGRGVRNSRGAPDFRVTAANGSTFDISISGQTTVGGVLDAINSATGGAVTASLVAGDNSIRLIDSTGGGGTLSVTALNGSSAAADLGIEQSVAGSQLDGKNVLASLNTVLLSSLRGGTGLSLGNISITDRTGASNSVDLSAAQNVQDILDAINNSGLAVAARLKASGNGIEITDTSGGSGDLDIGDIDSTTAAELGIAGTFTAAQASVQGANLQRKWISEDTLLSTYNGGKGVAPGAFKITNSLGASATVDLSQGNEKTLQDVIDEVNSKGIGVTASINVNGDGLLLTDAAGGAGTLKVEEAGSTTAADLNIKGTAVGAQINGSFEKIITVSGNDTLSSVQDAINALSYGVSASTIDDGSGAAPFRLSLTALNTGRAGRVIFDAGTTSLQARNLVEAQDAAVFYGGAGAAQPLVLTSNSNKISNVIKGVTLDLHGVGSGPVSVNISRNFDNVLSELKKFTDNFNQLVDKIDEDTAYNSQTNTKGVLLGDSTVQQVESQIYALLQKAVPEGGTFRSLSQIGLKLGDGSKLSIDEDKFHTAAATDSASLTRLFTFFQKGSAPTVPDKKGIGGILQDGINKLIDPTIGVLTRQNQSLDVRTQDFQKRITELDTLLADKRTRLENQFANLESVLAGLQTQQQALAGFTGIAPSTSAKSSSSK